MGLFMREIMLIWVIIFLKGYIAVYCIIMLGWGIFLWPHPPEYPGVTSKHDERVHGDVLVGVALHGQQLRGPQGIHGVQPQPARNQHTRGGYHGNKPYPQLQLSIKD